MQRRITTLVETTKRFRYHLSRSDVFDFLESRDIYPPLNASIAVHIPGGADWSNTSLDITDDDPIVVEWTSEETDHTEGD